MAPQKGGGEGSFSLFSKKSLTSARDRRDANEGPLKLGGSFFSKNHAINETKSARDLTATFEVERGEPEFFLHERPQDLDAVEWNLRPYIFQHRTTKIEGLIRLDFEKEASNEKVAIVGEIYPCECRSADKSVCTQGKSYGLSPLLWHSMSTLGQMRLINASPVDVPRVKASSTISIEILRTDDPLPALFDIPTVPFEARKAKTITALFRERLRGGVMANGQLTAVFTGGCLLCGRVSGAKTDDLVRIPDDMAVTLKVTTTSLSSQREEKFSDIVQAPWGGLASVGGLTEVQHLLRRSILFPLLRPDAFFDIREGKAVLRSVRPPKGVLLYGPPGSGKTYLSKAIADELETQWKDIQPWRAPRVYRIDGGSGSLSVSGVVAVFQEARRVFIEENRMCLILIDEVDALCSIRQNASSQSIQMTTVLLTHIDGIAAHPGMLLLATTNRPEALDDAIRRPGRLDREIEMGVPNVADRGKILWAMLRKAGVESALSGPGEAIELARKGHGFVAADIELWVNRAFQLAQAEAFDLATTESKRIECVLTRTHLSESLASVRPSALKELLVEVPATKWSDIGGYENVKQSLKECVEWPIKYWAEFERLKLAAPRGILLYGPPGNSKTLLARAVASESSMNFIAIKGPEIFSKWVGESEQTIRTIFRKAREHAPTIVFLDEVDSLAVNRQSSKGGGTGVESRVLAQLLNEMDGIAGAQQVVVIGATNRPDLLDAALLRPGRFDRHVYVPLPDRVARKQIFLVHTRSIPLQVPEDHAESYFAKSTDISFLCEGVNCSKCGAGQEMCAVRTAIVDALSEPQTSGQLSGAEIAMACRETRMTNLRQNLRGGVVPKSNYISIKDFEETLSKMTPRTSTQLIQFYENYSRMSEPKGLGKPLLAAT